MLLNHLRQSWGGVWGRWMDIFVSLRLFGFILLSRVICNRTPKDLETHSNVEIVGVTLLCAFYDTSFIKKCSESAFVTTQCYHLSIFCHISLFHNTDLYHIVRLYIFFMSGSAFTVFLKDAPIGYLLLMDRLWLFHGSETSSPLVTRHLAPPLNQPVDRIHQQTISQRGKSGCRFPLGRRWPALTGKDIRDS